MTVAERYQTKEKCQVEVYGNTNAFRGEVRNLSKTGALLQVYREKHTPKKGDLLNLTVMLDQLNRNYNFSAEVIWSNGLQVGVTFINQSAVYERLMAKTPTKS